MPLTTPLRDQGLPGEDPQRPQAESRGREGARSRKNEAAAGAGVEGGSKQEELETEVSGGVTSAGFGVSLQHDGKGLLLSIIRP